MNYFGHAVLASERTKDCRFVLGAMLPDLASILHTACPTSREPMLGDGLAFHHATDAVFHQTATFIELNHDAVHILRALGLRRGPARAVAHIGTEMLLDANLCRHEGHRETYQEALRYAAGSRLDLAWVSAELSQAFTGLATHLLDRGEAAHSATPERLSFRLARALEGRARLALGEDELPLVAHFGELFAPRVADVAESLLGEVRDGLVARAALRP